MQSKLPGSVNVRRAGFMSNQNEMTDRHRARFALKMSQFARSRDFAPLLTMPSHSTLLRALHSFHLRCRPTGSSNNFTVLDEQPVRLSASTPCIVSFPPRSCRRLRHHLLPPARRVRWLTGASALSTYYGFDIHITPLDREHPFALVSEAWRRSAVLSASAL